MTGELTDEWREASRLGTVRSGIVMLLAMLFLLLPVGAASGGLPAQPMNTGTLQPTPQTTTASQNPTAPVAVSDPPQLVQRRLERPPDDTGDAFGASMSVSGNTAVVGSPSMDGSHLGSAYVFVFINGAWRCVQPIWCPDPVLDSQFGSSVSVSGDDLIIGAPEHGPGSAYIYKRLNGTFKFVRKFEGEAEGDRFGCSVAVSQDAFMVGADGYDGGGWQADEPNLWNPLHWLNPYGLLPDAWTSSSTWVSSPDSGAAYLITRPSAAAWDFSKINPCKREGANFGCSVSISGNTALIGAKNVGKEEVGGAAYVFDFFDENARGFLPRVNAQSHALFGESVAISGNTALVGAPGSDGGKGSAVVYTRTNGTWSYRSTLTASDRAAADYFGDSVSLSGDTAVVGAPYDDIGGLLDGGSVYHYARSGTTWNQKRKTTPATPVAYGRFGSSVGVFGSEAMVGAAGSKQAFWCGEGVRYELNEDTTLTVPASDGVLVNDQCAGATPQLTNIESLHGSLKLATDGSFVYKPEANFNGIATANYRLVAGSRVSNVATITIVVKPVNDPPLARDDVETLAPDDVLLEYGEDGEGLLANDTDVDGDKLTISFRPEWPKHAGWCGVMPDGSFAYVPRARFIGTDTFTYTITDGHGASDTAKVTFKVGTGEPPVAVSDSELNQFKLFAVDPGIVRDIGWSVAVSGDTAIVGTGDTTATPAVYSYNRSGSVWNLEQRIRPPFVYDAAGFGTAVSASGNTMVVGAPGSGKVYVYTKPSALADWTFQATLSGPAFEEFGSSVAVSGDTIVVGASAANASGYSHAGAAYVYTRTAYGWSSPAKLTAATPASQASFGRSVSCSGNQVVVGAPGALDPDDRYHSGAAFVFTRNGRTWDSGVQLPVSALPDNASFGWSVSISGNTAAVGAWGERDYDNDRWGAAYVFTKGSGIWSLQKKLTEDGARSFGNAVSVSDDAFVVGAPSEESSGTGAAAYVYNRSGRQWSLRERLTSKQPDGAFGWAVATSGKTAIIGAPSDDWAGSAYIETGLSLYTTDGDKTMFVPASSGVLVNDRTIGLTPKLIDTGALHGTMRFLGDGSFTYTPETGFVGTATATYRVTDGERTSDPATITIVVNPPNHPPIARDDAATVACGEWLRVRAPGVLANDSDPDGDPLTIWLNEPQGAAVSLDEDGSYVFRAPHSPREISFTYTLSDGRGGTAVGTVKIHVFRDELKR